MSLGKRLQQVYEAAQVPRVAWTGEIVDEVLEDVRMQQSGSQETASPEMTFKETASGWSLSLLGVRPSTVLCTCLHDMGFTHRRMLGENGCEFLSQHCFLPGMEDLSQTTWLSVKEEQQIMSQCQSLMSEQSVIECFPEVPGLSSTEQLPIEEGEDEVEEIAIPDGVNDVDSDEDGGPITTDWKPSAKELKALELLHRNLGHPPSHKLAKVLKLGGVRSDVWKWVKDSFTCDECTRMRPPKPNIPARLPTVWRLNAILGIDVAFVAPPGGNKSETPWLNVVDWGTGYQQVDQVDGQLNAHTAWRAFCRCWL
eukprot:6490749-Amphidinium_carterae.1